jgi:8-oxo-dGTP diphosphatase
MIKDKELFTHQLAANAYLMDGDRFLLLKRNREPFIWAPPGGRLEKNEDPLAGLEREVKEETGLEIEIITPANTWFGKWKGNWLLSIDYLALKKGGKIRLSEEHTDFRWITFEELERGDSIQLHPGFGFQLSDFRHALKIYNHLCKP